MTARVAVEIRKGIRAGESHNCDAHGEESELIMFHVKGSTEFEIFNEVTRFIREKGMDIDLSPGRALHILIYDITNDAK